MCLLIAAPPRTLAWHTDLTQICRCQTFAGPHQPRPGPRPLALILTIPPLYSPPSVLVNLTTRPSRSPPAPRPSPADRQQDGTDHNGQTRGPGEDGEAGQRGATIHP